MLRTPHLAAALAAVLLLPAHVPAQQPAGSSRAAEPGRTVALAAPLTEPLPDDSAVRAGRLENGLRYFVRRNTKPEERAELRLVVDVGSVLEEDGQRGLAHLVEHMAFNGTRRFAKQDIVGYLESVGMRFGPDLNAYTSFDETVYMLTLPTDSGDVLARGVDILGEWAEAISFDSLEVVRERPVVIEEWRLGQGAATRLRDAQLPVIFQGSRYARRLPIGDTAVVRSATAADLRRFYETWYRPELMAVVAVGDFDEAAVEQLIRQRFNSLRNVDGAPPREQAAVPGHAETLVAIATDPEATGTLVSVLYKHPATPERTLGDFRRQLVEALYNDMFNARLYEVGQQANAPFLGAGSSKGRFLRARDAYTLGAGVADSGVVRGLEALLVEAARVDRHGFTAGELARAKADLLRRMERAYAERDKTPSAAFASEYVDAFLQQEPYPATSTAWALYQRFVPEIALADVDRLGREFISDSNRVVLVSAPRKAGVQLPTETELLAVFDRVGEMSIAGYEDRAADAPLVATTPTPGRIVGERRHDEAQVVEWTLANGVRVLVKPTRFKDDEILLRGRSPGGHSLAPDSIFLSASVAAAIAQTGGVGPFDRVQLDKALAGKAAGAAPGIGALEETISGSAAPSDVETMFQLVYLYFTAPREDSAAFATLQTRLRASFENRGRSPESAFGDTLQVTLAQHHPRARPLTPALLPELDLGTALRFYRDRFADAGDFTFAIVGNVDTTALRLLVEQWLGALPSAGRTESWRDVGITPPPGVVRRTVYRGVEPKAQTQFVFHGPTEFTPDRRFVLAALAQILDLRLRDVLREELGGTYGASVGGSIAREPHPRYTLAVNFSSAPARLEELTAVVLHEIDSLKANGPDAGDVAKVQEMMRRTMETSAEQNGFWLGHLLAYDQLGLPFADIAREHRFVDALTAGQLRDAARRYFDTSRYVQVSLLPEKEL